MLLMNIVCTTNTSVPSKKKTPKPLSFNRFDDDLQQKPQKDKIAVLLREVGTDSKASV